VCTITLKFHVHILGHSSLAPLLLLLSLFQAPTLVLNIVLWHFLTLLLLRSFQAPTLVCNIALWLSFTLLLLSSPRADEPVLEIVITRPKFKCQAQQRICMALGSSFEMPSASSCGCSESITALITTAFT
jgi:hypothetical protein